MTTFFKKDTDVHDPQKIDHDMVYTQGTIFALFLGQLHDCCSVECHRHKDGGWRVYSGRVRGYNGVYVVHMEQVRTSEDFHNVCSIECVNSEDTDLLNKKGSGVFSHNANAWIQISEHFSWLLYQLMTGYALRG